MWTPLAARACVELLAQVCGEQLGQAAAHRSLPRDAGQPFDLRVPALDTIIQIRRQNADVDRFDDVLAELLQPLVLFHLALQRTVQPRVLDRDATYPESVISSSTSSLDRKSPLSVRLTPR